MAYITCKQCGCQMSDKSEACPVCGTPINQNVENPIIPTYEKTSSSKTKNNFLIIGISVIVVLAMTVSVIIIRNNKKEQEANQYRAEQELVKQKQLQEELKARYEQELEEQKQIQKEQQLQYEKLLKEQESSYSQTNTVEDESTLNLYDISYNSYCNSRFGFCVSYPSFFKRQYESYSQDGCEFYFGNNYSLTVSGIFCDDSSITSLFNNSKKQTDTYTASKNNWFVLSGINEQGNIYYQKTILKNDVDYTILIVYPKDKKDQYASILKTVINSFEIL